MRLAVVTRSGGQRSCRGLPVVSFMAGTLIEMGVPAEDAEDWLKMSHGDLNDAVNEFFTDPGRRAEKVGGGRCGEVMSLSALQPHPSPTHPANHHHHHHRASAGALVIWRERRQRKANREELEAERCRQYYASGVYGAPPAADTARIVLAQKEARVWSHCCARGVVASGPARATPTPRPSQRACLRPQLRPRPSACTCLFTCTRSHTGAWYFPSPLGALPGRLPLHQAADMSGSLVGSTIKVWDPVYKTYEEVRQRRNGRRGSHQPHPDTPTPQHAQLMAASHSTHKC